MASGPRIRRAKAGEASSWPTWTPSAPISRARSGRSFKMKGTPMIGADAPGDVGPVARSERASSSLSRSWTTSTPPSIQAVQELGQVGPVPGAEIEVPTGIEGREPARPTGRSTGGRRGRRPLSCPGPFLTVRLLGRRRLGRHLLGRSFRGQQSSWASDFLAAAFLAGAFLAADFSGCRRLGLRLQLLFESADPVQRRGVGDVGDRAVSCRRRRRVPRPGASLRVATPSCFPRRATKILAFCSPKPGSCLTRVSSSVARGDPLPDVVGLSAVLVDEHPGQLLDPAGHRTRVAVESGPGREGGGQRLGVHRGDLLGVEIVAQPTPEFGRPGEGPFEWNLLVEDHPDQESQRVLG